MSDTVDYKTCAGHDCDKTQDTALLRRCSRCHITYYCSADCQRAHWKDHKKFCREDDQKFPELINRLGSTVTKEGSVGNFVFGHVYDFQVRTKFPQPGDGAIYRVRCKSISEFRVFVEAMEKNVENVVECRAEFFKFLVSGSDYSSLDSNLRKSYQEKDKEILNVQNIPREQIIQLLFEIGESNLTTALGIPSEFVNNLEEMIKKYELNQ